MVQCTSLHTPTKHCSTCQHRCVMHFRCAGHCRQAENMACNVKSAQQGWGPRQPPCPFLIRRLVHRASTIWYLGSTEQHKLVRTSPELPHAALQGWLAAAYLPQNHTCKAASFIPVTDSLSAIRLDRKLEPCPAWLSGWAWQHVSSTRCNMLEWGAHCEIWKYCQSTSKVHA